MTFALDSISGWKSGQSKGAQEGRLREIADKGVQKIGKFCGLHKWKAPSGRTRCALLQQGMGGGNAASQKSKKPRDGPEINRQLAIGEE